MRAPSASGSRRGRKLLAAVKTIDAELDAEWARHIGVARVEALRTGLQDVLAGVYGDALPPEPPTWLSSPRECTSLRRCCFVAERGRCCSLPRCPSR